MHGSNSHPESTFKRLGKSHASISWSNNSILEKSLAGELKKHQQKLYRYLQGASLTDERVSMASVWFLDNYHVLVDAVTVSQDCLIPGFSKRLPNVDGDSRVGMPRILLLACELISISEMRIDEELLRGALSDYQQHAPLTVAEIWALPVMLRLVLLETCLSSITRLLPEKIYSSRHVLKNCVSLDINEETIISRAIHALRLLGTINWTHFFDAVSTLEEALAGDPAGTYVKMDFPTRDRYRSIIENIAWQLGCSEIKIAQQVIKTAGHAPTGDIRRSHIGYYLIDRGRSEFEQSIGYRPRIGERMRRWIKVHATGFYLSSLAFAVSLFMLPPLWLLARDRPPVVTWVVLAILALLPAFSLGVELLQWAITRIFSPERLPRMDFSKGIANKAKTIVAVPAMLDNTKLTTQLISDLEVRYLSNPDHNLSFVLLTDFTDASAKELPQDQQLLDLAESGIKHLNDLYGETDRDKFYLMHRERLWSEGEKIWKGWERKRGKIVEFNRWIQGDDVTSFRWRYGRVNDLRGARFVITLDADTMMPKGAARSLASIMAHPLNEAEFDSKTRRVIAGYTVVQPRVEIDPASEESSVFTRILSGDIGIDPYSHAVSDAYQELFGTGIYVGKGIYDVATFTASLAHTLPPRRVLSHDLLEGVLGRAGLASDICVYEHYPPNYIAFTRRMHRWIRGDWQLIPWLLPRIPVIGGQLVKNPIQLIDRWKILDNLRRSLFFPFLMAFLLSVWLMAPSALPVWTLLGILAPAAFLIVGLIIRVVDGFRRSARRGIWMALRDLNRIDLERWFLFISFTGHMAIVTVDAIARTLVRMYITHHHLLEWVTFSTANAHARKDTIRKTVWREMWFASFIAATALVLIAAIRPEALPYGAPVMLLWILAPELARWLSMPPKEIEIPALDQGSRKELRELAFRTWHFFEAFVEPNSHWLPPDNFQESPRGEIAQRTSPTNIAMMFLAIVVARDMGFIGIANFTRRLKLSLDTLEHMPRYRGHILNWVDTSTLEPLEPMYVSTVDSGNLAGALITLRQACLGMESQHNFYYAQLQGLDDLLGLLEHSVSALLEHTGTEAPETLEAIHDIRNLIQQRGQNNLDMVELLTRLRKDDCRHLDKALLDLLHRLRGNVALADLEEIETWSSDLIQHVESMQIEVETCFPWLNLLLIQPGTEAAADQAELDSVWQELREIAQLPTRLSDVADIAARMRLVLRNYRNNVASDQSPEIGSWVRQLELALDRGTATSLSIRKELKEVAETCTREIELMDFSLLYDAKRNLFHIGYNVNEKRLDPNHYDLVMSEARLASFIAIARGVAPISHWSQMSRPVKRSSGMMILMSWSGTMFEYLMPTLLMRSNRHTLLSRGNASAVQQQIAYARKCGVPWGISESGYYRFDPHLKYQYKAFGVPALGLKRGLGEDLVISPYASLLALPIQPQAVMENIRHLTSLGAVGRYGFFEALDFTRTRSGNHHRFQVVRSYMAHHQGMILCALGNYLNAAALVNLFHADPLVRSAESLLNERVPQTISTEDIQPEHVKSLKPRKRIPPLLHPWTPSDLATVPQINLLSNGRLSTRITDHGAGALCWSGLSLTRWRADTTRDHCGYWIYIRDENRHVTWSATEGPVHDDDLDSHVVFFPHKVEFTRQRDDIFIRTEVCVAPGDDVDIRRVEIQNNSGQERRITVTSYAEIVMAEQRSDEMHPAFEKLFTESRYNADLDLLEFQRRRRKPEEQAVVLAHCGFCSGNTTRELHYETDRSRFLGRGRNVSRPAGLANQHLSGTTGHTLDTIMCFQVPVTLRPYSNKTVNFLTAVAATHEKTRESIKRYHNDASCLWAFQEAMFEHQREIAAIGIDPSSMGDVQRLLSELHYPNGRIRSPYFNPGNVRVEQPDLWSFGISGDFPITLLKLRNTDEMSLLEILLKAHHYWRSRGQHTDLVVLSYEPSTYGNKANEIIERVVSEFHGKHWLSKHGGIFVFSEDQISTANAKKLEAAAMAVLDSESGPLSRQLRAQDKPAQQLPRLLPTQLPARESKPSMRINGLCFENEYGGFSADGREYIIHVEEDKRPPAPWCNVLSNPRFGSLTTEGGGGYSWFLNSGEYRLTPWSNDPVTDQPAEMLYLRDEQSTQIWSPLPLSGQSGQYRIHHGAGYTSYINNNHQLEQKIRVFVPPDDSVKIVELQLKNIASHHRRLTATYYAEWVLGSQRSITQSHITTQYITRLQGIFANCTWNTDFGSCVAFLASSHSGHSFTCDRTEFLGRHGSTDRPLGLERIGFKRRSGTGIDPCAALQIHIELDPQEEATYHFVLGAETSWNRAKRLCRKYKHASEVENAWKRMNDYWDELLGTIVIKTPEPSMDLLLNRWLLYQAISSRIFARTGFYQSSGAYGFRDQLQDIMAVLAVKPELARQQILEAAKRQFDSGDVLHWWHPPSGKGVRTRCSDDLLWLPYVTGEYVKVTGDKEILNESISFLSAPQLEQWEEGRYGEFGEGIESATLLEHCHRALQKGLTSGPKGLPLIGSGDWNDAMDRVGVEGRGESVWLAWFACTAAQAYFELCRFAGDSQPDAAILKWVESVQDTLQQKAWDGAWYRRAFYDDGTPIGSATENECQIDSISQSWATLSCSSSPGRARQALDSAIEFLVNEKERIISLLTPPFDSDAHDPGYIKAYPPGVRENGGQYSHAAVWLAWALAQQGDGDRAEWLFRLLNPILRKRDPDSVARYRVEPYVLAADIYNSDQHMGRGGWTWYTGSASWLWRLGIERLLGLQRRGDELIFDPCIPRKWQGFSAQIRINGALIKVEVLNPGAVCSGVKSIQVGDRSILSNRIALNEIGAQDIIVQMTDKSGDQAANWSA